MNLFDLYAKITLDDSDYKKGVKSVKSSFGNLASTVKSGVSTIGKGAAALGKFGVEIAKYGAVALTAGTTAVTAISKLALDAYGEYEQLVGGVETLFGAGGKSLEEYAASVGKTVDEVRGEYETLMSSQSEVLKNADNAYKTAGMSANEYMNTVNGFAASLIQSVSRVEQTNIDELQASLDAQYEAEKRSLEDQYDAVKADWDNRINLAKRSKDRNAVIYQQQRDEELKALKRSNEDKLAELKAYGANQVKLAEEANNTSVKSAASQEEAAKLANQAVIDMADNANKMGTSMEMIQNAYQGFAKQNYTMLDNLKLGYGGTQEEMKRLLADAEKISGIQYDLSSFADIVDAIHVIQTEMGITGTTELEASTTIQGSISSMKAAWQNLLAGLANEEADLDKLVNDLVDSAVTVAGNISPKLLKILPNIGNGLKTLAKKLAPEVEKFIEENGPPLLESVEDLLGSLAEQLPDILDKVASMIPSLATAAWSIVSKLGKALIASAPALLESVEKLIGVSLDKVPDMLDKGVSAMSDLAKVAGSFVSKLGKSLIDLAPKVLEKLQSMLKQVDWKQLGVDFYNWFASIDWDGPNGIIQQIFQLIGTAFASLGSFLWGLFKTGFEELNRKFTEWKDDPNNEGRTAGEFIIEALADGVGDVAEWAYDNIIAPLIAGLTGKNLEEVKEAGAGVGEAISDAISSAFSLDATYEKVLNGPRNIWTALTGGLRLAFATFAEAINTVFDENSWKDNNWMPDWLKSIINGSHASGLDYVPYDGYIAQLHRGETVLTRSEADNYRNYHGGNTINITVNGAKYTDENALAERLSEIIQFEAQKEAAAFG